ncbi:MAG: dihydroneopterin aldolase [Candidatus Reconcilbacillus cellulovorans]|uniref:7,8-dihydroneopterin aldolase n=1 Tax=Candidatus Reconcilbacillus cellulovorans TaxID=1906605 RepID=A0A2A6E1N5_9BACL|nr:MAG: dihydroneopterin aldolase [Candidatus Reconcilbacillus cellulovorans]
MDKLILHRLRFYGKHGVLPEENRLGQTFLVDLELSLDLSRAGRSDDLRDSVHYAEVIELVRDVVERETYRLIERVAERIAERVLAGFPQVRELVVRLTKPNPPVRMAFDGVSVEIRRRRLDE